jgi:tetratricopeptide (TPR) repeat protein
MKRPSTLCSCSEVRQRGVRSRTPRISSHWNSLLSKGWATRACVALLASLYLTAAQGEPRIPTSDEAILERLPAPAATRELMPLRRALLNNPDDLGAALQLSRGYLEISRSTSDPRFVSYAEAVLARWMQQPAPPAAVLVLKATALQSLHRFDEALALLDRALALDPDNTQAWLTKATLLQVQGRFAEARRACQPLLRTADQLIALTCLLTVDSLSGGLQRSYEALQRVALTSEQRQPRGDAWVSGQLAEMAVRLADFAAAERHFKLALQVEPDDVYLRAAYADLLLIRGRHDDVIELLEHSASHDVLLLRLAIAGRRSNAQQTERWITTFDARRRAVRPDDNPHFREHARFLLDVVDRPADALDAARKNWAVQREPADVQIYWQAARASQSAADERVVLEWIAQTGFEDRTLQPLRSGAAL